MKETNKTVEDVRKIHFENEKGSISLFVLTSMLFFSIVVVGFYIGINNKVAKQENEINKISQRYTQEDIDMVYNKALKQPDQPLFPGLNKSETDPEAALPENYKTIIEDEPSKGIVVRDINNNEWTWVIVPKSIYRDSNYTVANGGRNVTSETDYTGIYNILNAYAQDYREGRVGQGRYWSDEWYDGCGIENDATYTAMYQKMLESTYENGGFWIARYEAGIEGTNIDNTTGRTSHTNITTTSPKSTSQKDMIPYNFVTCSEAQTLASAMSSDNNKTSSLLFGIQWDLVCKYIETNSDLNVADINVNSQAWGNYSNTSIILNSGKYNINPGNSSSVWKMYNVDTLNYVETSRTSSNTNYFQLLTTGASLSTSKLNIFDFAGNLYEWTLENANRNDGKCCVRGEIYNYDSGSPAAVRSYANSTHSNESKGFRATIY